MKKIISSIILFFTSIDYPALWKSCKEVLFLTAIALFPLILNIFIASVQINDFIEPLKPKIIPGEMLSYCLSFLAPSLYLLTKTHGSGYRLPLVHFFSISTLIIYCLCIVLYLIAKNHWVPEINMDNLKTHKIDLYFRFALIFFATSIIYRIYSVYHGKKASTWSDTRNEQQNDFNTKFRERING